MKFVFIGKMAFEPIKYELRIKILSNDDKIKNWYQNFFNHHLGDSGVDLLTPCYIENVNCLDVSTIDFEIQAEMIDVGNNVNTSYYLVPRSSIANTNFQLANSVGIIDASYRGNLKAKIRCFADNGFIAKYTSLFQIVAPDLKPIKCIVVENLSVTTRNSGGFGSTNQ